MEIFAVIDKEKRLVTLTLEELALIMGYESTWDAGRVSGFGNVGTKVDIKKFTNITTNIRTLNTTLLKGILSDLETGSRFVAEAIEKSNEINCFNKLKDGT
jgi:hypothetical protein